MSEIQIASAIQDLKDLAENNTFDKDIFYRNLLAFNESVRLLTSEQNTNNNSKKQKTMTVASEPEPIQNNNIHDSTNMLYVRESSDSSIVSQSSELSEASLASSILEEISQLCAKHKLASVQNAQPSRKRKEVSSITKSIAREISFSLSRRSNDTVSFKVTIVNCKIYVSMESLIPLLTFQNYMENVPGLCNSNMIRMMDITCGEYASDRVMIDISVLGQIKNAKYLDADHTFIKSCLLPNRCDIFLDTLVQYGYINATDACTYKA